MIIMDDQDSKIHTWDIGTGTVGLPYFNGLDLKFHNLRCK